VNYSPASANHGNIWTISAVNGNDVWASFSNYGNPPVDFAEPGVGIYSTYKGGAYATLSGTSMAAPHMAGILLFTNTPGASGTAINDPDGYPDPIGILP
jgi:subtilisin family serine protease